MYTFDELKAAAQPLLDAMFKARNGVAHSKTNSLKLFSFWKKAVSIIVLCRILATNRLVKCSISVQLLVSWTMTAIS